MTSVIADIGVTMEDLMPKAGDEIIVLHGGCQNIISRRLHERLQAYAASNGISLVRALARLQAEIHDY